MNAAVERVIAELGATPRATGAAPALREALARGLPTTRDENWKYASLRALERVRLQPVLPQSPALEQARAVLPARLEAHHRIVLVDGELVPALSDPLPAGVSFAVPSSPPASHADGDLRWAAVNAAFATGELKVGVDTSGALAIEVCCVTTLDAAAGASHPRLSLRLAPSARLSVVERQLSPAQSTALTNIAIDAEIGTAANLRHVRVQTLGDRAQYLDTVCVRAGADARYEQLHVQLGAQAARSTGRIELAGRGASCLMQVAALADGTRVHDGYCLIDHQAPQTSTEQRIRGIAAQRARVAFNGHIRMAAGAVGAASDQSLRGLQSGTQCEIDLRPQLEIYVDAVKAAHGATVGKLDEQMLFYLMSRGLDRDTAQGLLKWAFVADVLTRLATGPLRRQIEVALARHMGDAPTLQEAS
ncbi:MAG: SufD family Fe-S cluster assembly protein [Steroidobacteraceae bacterium]